MSGLVNATENKGSNDAIAVVFMCEPGNYEWQAILLAATLKAFCYDDNRLYAYCREELIGDLRPETLRALEGLDVQLNSIAPKFADVYPQGNKIYACAEKRAEHCTLFLDTDVMLVQPSNISALFVDGYVSGCATSTWMWGDTLSDWQGAYEAASVTMPSNRMFQGRGKSGRYVAPSLNAGVVAYAGSALADEWLRVALAVEACDLVKDIYPTLDQIALPIAIASSGQRINLLSREWNVSADGVVSGRVAPIFFHYHSRVAINEGMFATLANNVIADFTDFENLKSMYQFYLDNGAQPDIVKGTSGFKARFGSLFDRPLSIV